MAIVDGNRIAIRSKRACDGRTDPASGPSDQHISERRMRPGPGSAHAHQSPYFLAAFLILAVNTHHAAGFHCDACSASAAGCHSTMGRLDPHCSPFPIELTPDPHNTTHPSF